MASAYCRERRAGRRNLHQEAQPFGAEAKWDLPSVGASNPARLSSAGWPPPPPCKEAPRGCHPCVYPWINYAFTPRFSRLQKGAHGSLLFARGYADESASHRDAPPLPSAPAWGAGSCRGCPPLPPRVEMGSHTADFLSHPVGCCLSRCLEGGEKKKEANKQKTKHRTSSVRELRTRVVSG